MLPKKDHLKILIKSNVSFVLYGHKASGKTTLIRNIFSQTNSKYLQINCTLANKRANFLKLFNVSLIKYLQQYGCTIQLSKQTSNIQIWLTQIKISIQKSQQICKILDNVYIFLDNIEQLVLAQSFLPSFYSTCQKQFKFRFNFIFCGVNFSKKQYSLQLPFRTMISFCMAKPIQLFQLVIIKTIIQKLKNYCKDKNNQDQIEKGSRLLMRVIKSSYETIQISLQKIKILSGLVFQGIKTMIDNKDVYKSIQKIVNNGQLMKIIRIINQKGFSQQKQLTRKINQGQKQQFHQLNPHLQYYPNLILSSIHLADYYPEKEDKRRFQDYKIRSNFRNKELKKLQFKIGKHNIQRIIAISQALQSQAKDNQKQQKLQHHSLDYYAQFQHLRRINRIKIISNKCNGLVKEEQVKAFFNKNNLQYQQFMSN